ncbi:ferritin-like protein [Chromobacterium sp. IIBBL 290-4]|uniref:ferritin-like domain-containing protein n=1 Tax=Chromobacterium sp. IIBBL 290-4 TaxID=2953890 RepID=UPI0020B8661E|nr:ferritin-like protein [Chromobacterium sp. IIBBL 290-4]UTH74057.1 ferritin-like protein [Chromobacterium sp. IIBBL 290-4]
MHKIDPKFINRLLAATEPAQLHEFLQKAVELEHSTIPPYLAAMFSLKPGCNREIGGILHGIVMQEMLHMTIAANILIAIGGHPKINTPEFIPKYPGPLPMGIGDGLIVGIEAFSLELVSTTFMSIEEPEHPIPIQKLKMQQDYRTIGQFYQAIKDKLIELQDALTFGNRERQVLNYFPDDELFAIDSLDSALDGIDIIVRQGEGACDTPYQNPNAPERFDDLAHYYKFESIANQRQISPCPDQKGYCFGGPAIPFDKNGVWEMRPDPKPEDYPPNSQARALIERFAYSYSSLLNCLHQAFNGQPEKMDSAIGLMFDLKVLSASLMNPSILLGFDDKHQPLPPIGLSFVYRDVQSGMSYD